MAMLRFLDPRGSIDPVNRLLIPGLDSLEGSARALAHGFAMDEISDSHTPFLLTFRA